MIDDEWCDSHKSIENKITWWEMYDVNSIQDIHQRYFIHILLHSLT